MAASLKWISACLMLSVAFPLCTVADEDMPAPRGEAVAPTADIPPGPAYRSERLKGEFVAQWLYIRPGGNRITFWGARITHLEPDSPLRDLGLSEGDVVTRLDGTSIANGMYRRRHSQTGEWYYVIPELNRHFGRTQVRHIFSGTHEVLEGEVHLGSLGGGGGGGGGLTP